MIYTHVLNRGGRGVNSPLDRMEASAGPKGVRLEQARQRPDEQRQHDGAGERNVVDPSAHRDAEVARQAEARGEYR